MTAHNANLKELEAAKAKLRSLLTDYTTLRKENARNAKRAQIAEGALTSANSRLEALGARLEATRNRSMMLEERAKDVGVALADASKAAASAPETRANAHRYFQQLTDARDRLQEANAELQAARKTIARLKHAIKVEIERTGILADKAKPLRERNLMLEERLKTLAIQLKGANSKVELLGLDNDRLRQTVTALEGQDVLANSAIGDAIKPTLERIDKANEIAEARRETVFNLRDRLDLQNERVRKLHNLQPISATMAFAEAALATVPDSVDCIVTHGMQPLAAAGLAPPGRFKRMVNDCIEIPSLHERPNTDKFESVVLDWLSRSLTSYLLETEVVLTVSDSLADHLHQIGCANVVSLPNYRRAQPVAAPGDFRSVIGVPDEAVLLLSVGTLSKGWKPLLEGLAEGPENVFLASLGSIPSEGDAGEIKRLIETLGLGGRVHLRDPAPYEALSSICATADAGVIVLQPETVGNHAVALPNRVFDLLSGGVPIISPELPDIARLIERFDCGLSLSDASAAGWAQAISQVQARAETWRAGAIKANQELTWESHLPVLKSVFEGMKHVAFIGHGDLTLNNRTFRMATDLLELGLDVTLISRKEADRARFVTAGAAVHVV